MKNKPVAAAVIAVGAVAAVADIGLMVATPAAGPAATPSPAQGTSAAAGSSSGSASAGQTSDGAGALKDGTYTGAVVSTAKGDVQVSVTVSGGKITKVSAVKYPNDNPRSQSISGAAVETLSTEAVDAQSANIQMVSGATETSTGFIGSLQDALNQAQ